MRAEPDFEFVDAVTSDLSFVAHGTTLEDLFRAAAEALLAATLENPESVGGAEQRSLALSEPDLDLLLLRFLNELVYLRDAEALLLRPDELEISRDGEVHLEAELAGERIEPGRHHLAAEVKAATAHDLRVEPDGDGWRASVTLDV